MVTTELNPTVEKKSIRCLEENRLLLKNVKKMQRHPETGRELNRRKKTNSRTNTRWEKVANE